MPGMATIAPDFAISRAVATPITPLAPVIKIVFSSYLYFCIIL